MIFKYSSYILLILSSIKTCQAKLDESTNVQATWRAFHSSAAIKDTNLVVFYGGITSPLEGNSIYDAVKQGSSDILVFNIEDQEWHTPNVSNSPTQPQALFSAVSQSSELFALVPNAPDDKRLHILDTRLWQWTYPSLPSSAPSSRLGFSFSAVGDVIYLYGGSDVDTEGNSLSGSILTDLNALKSSQLTWQSLSNSLQRQFHSACYIESIDSIITFGGTDQNLRPFSTVQTYNLSMARWDVSPLVGPTEPRGPTPSARMLHTALCTSDNMIVFGGGSSPFSPVDSDVWILDSDLKWSKAPIANPESGPTARLGHSASLLNNKMYIFGGVGANDDANLYVLDLSEWNWTVIQPNPSVPSKPDPSNPTRNRTSENDGDNQTVLIAALISGFFAIIAVGVIAAVGFRNYRRKRRVILDEEKDQAINVSKKTLPPAPDDDTTDSDDPTDSWRDVDGSRNSLNNSSFNHRAFLDESKSRLSALRNSITHLTNSSGRLSLDPMQNSWIRSSDNERNGESSSPTSVAPIRYMQLASESQQLPSSVPLARPITPPIPPGLNSLYPSIRDGGSRDSYDGVLGSSFNDLVSPLDRLARLHLQQRSDEGNEQNDRTSSEHQVRKSSSYLHLPEFNTEPQASSSPLKQSSSDPHMNVDIQLALIASNYDSPKEKHTLKELPTHSRTISSDADIQGDASRELKDIVRFSQVSDTPSSPDIFVIHDNVPNTMPVPRNSHNTSTDSTQPTSTPIDSLSDEDNDRKFLLKKRTSE